jgi:hypothetical protein
MALTAAQRTAIKADILSTKAGYWNSNQLNALAELYNVTAAPDYIVWKTSVTASQMHTAYVWTELDNLSQAKFNQLTLMLSEGSVNPSLVNIRQGFSDIFTTNCPNTRTALIALSKRKATVAEKMFATGTGSDPSPATLSFEGTITAQDIVEAMANG